MQNIEYPHEKSFIAKAPGGSHCLRSFLIKINDTASVTPG
jgi:hypothetical protein